MPSPPTRLVQAERDAVACLGLFGHVYARFDVPVDYPNESAPSHVLGLNIHAAIIDNVDGELLALDRNTIHSDGSPLQHGEQRALRAAINRVSTKRPRKPSQAIEDYYRSSMFMGKGKTPEDYLNVGATLFTTLEPCPMCASAALVSRVKRIVFLLADKKYGGAWTMLKDRYYATDESTCGALSLPESGSKFADRVAALHTEVDAKADALRKKGVRDTHLLDFCRDEMEAAFELLRTSKAADLASVSAGEERNAITLRCFQRALNMPHS